MSPSFYLQMEFQPGDIQLLNNAKILHVREAYTDYDDPAERRHHRGGSRPAFGDYPGGQACHCLTAARQPGSGDGRQQWCQASDAIG